MNNRAVTLSFFMAIAAMFMVSSYVNSIEEDTKKKFGTEVLVIKAKRDIHEAETITETVLELSRLPKRFLEPSAVFFEKSNEDKETTAGLKEMSGRIAIVPIKKGEQLTYNKLTEPGIRTGLAPQVAPGRRAVAIPVGEVTGVSKLVKPGDRVDLIAVIDRGGGKDAKIARTVLQDVVVLAVGRNVSGTVGRIVEPDALGGKDHVRSLAEDFSFSSVTVEVEPAQAQMLALLMANGDNAITLSLRNNDDTDRQPASAMTFDDVLGPDAARLRAAMPQGRR